MARFQKKLSYAEKRFDRYERLRSNGVDTKPLEAHRVDHHRVGDSWRQRKSKDVYRGARGKQKILRGPKQPL